MRWSYKTVHYELKKEGLLGSAFLDESEIEFSLNEYGRAGWELVSILETMDGIIAVFKQQLSSESSSFFNINPAENEQSKILPEEQSETAGKKVDPDSLKAFTREKIDMKKEREAPILDEFEIVESDSRGEENVEEESPGSGGDIGSIRIE